MRLALLINRSAGSFRHLVLESTVSAVMRALKAGGHSVELVICGRRNLPVRAAELAARDDLDGVVVGGGDGTILTAIRAGLGRGIVLGLLPLGTLNLLARDLGLPLVAAAEAIR